VRDVSNLRLDPSQTRLTATITFVASVQKKAPPAARGGAQSKPGASPSGAAAAQGTAKPNTSTPAVTNRPAQQVKP
jgi:hypothetical protein